MSDKRPIGVFDSGLGGLCAVKELRHLLPKEDIIYFGDTGRVPYGSKSPETIIRYAKEDADFLYRHGVKAIIAACGTVSAVALEKIKDDFDIPLLGVVDCAAEAAKNTTQNGKIAVIGTKATIDSKVFEKKLGEKHAVSQACPLFVHLVECGFTQCDNEITRSVCKSYLADIKASGADTLILGCTHFPIISDIIADFLPGVNFINPAKEAARNVTRFLAEKHMLSSLGGKTEYYVSDDCESFSSSAQIFLGNDEKITAKLASI